jgi:replication factor C small subunit
MQPKTNTIWVEKYRPDSLEGYIGNEKMKAKFAGYIANKDIPHLLLHGPPGTGKTTAAKILMNAIPSDRMYINASDENNVETVRTKIRGFASARGFSPLKIMLLDEFDGFSRGGQEALRNLMEQFSATTRFILTANYAERVHEAIFSRSQDYKVVPPSKLDAARLVARILKTEGVEYVPTDIKTLVEAYFPDIRKIIGTAQLSSSEGKLTIDAADIVENDFKLKLVARLATGRGSAHVVTDIRQLIADTGQRDFIDVYRYLYDKVTEFAPNNVSQAILHIAEGQYRDSMVVDKEINLMATVINLLETL